MITTIKLQKETKARLEKLKEHRRETYDEIIKKILWILNTLRIDPGKSREILERIDESRKRMLEEMGKKKSKKIKAD